MREVLFVREAVDLALATSHLAQSSSASRFTPGASAFFILSQPGNDAKVVILLIARLNAFG
jgi:hypothetical protein